MNSAVNSAFDMICQLSVSSRVSTQDGSCIRIGSELIVNASSTRGLV